MALAFFYFDFADKEKQRQESMIRSFIVQISEKCLNRPQALTSLYASCVDGERHPTLNDFLLVLQKLVEGFEQTYIILDGLDECENRKEQLAVLTDIKRMTGWKLAKTHILLTSRYEHDIDAFMISMDPLIGDQNKISFQNTFIEQDIHAYVHHILQTDPKLSTWPEEMRLKIVQSLMKNSHGM